MTLYQRACKVIPGGVNSPVRSFKGVGGEPLFISKAKGAYIYDQDHKKYVDYVGSWGPMIAGHAHPDIISAVEKAIENGLSYGAPTVLEIELAELICKLMPNIEMVRMVNSGTEATMSAIRLARGYTNKNKIIKFNGCYHGHSDSLLVKSGSGGLTFGIPDSAGVPKSFAEHTLIAEFNDLDDVEKLFKNYPDDIAAIIVEPVAGNMNCILPDKNFLIGLRELCNHYKSLLIFDEVMTGFRVALGGAQERYNIKPDLTTLGKIIGGGMPVGAFGGKREIMEKISPLGPVYQAGTLSGNPIAMAAGLASLKLIQEPGFYEQLEINTKRLLINLMELADKYHIPFYAQHAGSMFGLFFTDQEEINNLKDVEKCNIERFKKFFHKMLEQGIYLAPSAFEAGFLSAMHQEKEIDQTLSAAERVFAEAFEMTAKIIETHISWIILTGKYAYKIKKPLDLEFLDYSSLAKRKFYCEEELRLNKIYAPELYIKVISVKKNNKIIDYAVVMNQFEQKYLFANLLASGELLPEYFIDLADQMANFHTTAEIAPGKFGSLENIWFPVQQNFDQIRPYLLKAENSQKLLSQLEICESWAREQFEKYQKIFKSRKKKGFIRECHGDLHLGNIVLYKDKPLIFDRIEFNDNFRYTDTMGDIGFLLMDLDEKNQAELGNIFLNQYLTLTGDYEGLSILRFYQAYRAVVRAKIKLMGPHIDWQDYKLSIDLAEKYARFTHITQTPELFIMHGISGSGKTTRARLLAKKYRAIHIRSDVERKRICQDKNKLYTEAVNRKVYDRLYKLAEELLHQGYSVVVDATFLKKTEREQFQKLPSRFHIVPCEIDDKLRKIRLDDRRQDYSDADYQIAQRQQKTIELLTPEERKYIYV